MFSDVTRQKRSGLDKQYHWRILCFFQNLWTYRYTHGVKLIEGNTRLSGGAHL